MKSHNRYRVSMVLAPTFVLMALTFRAPQMVGAQVKDLEGNLPDGMTLHGDGFFHGATVTIDGDVDGDVFALGGEIIINGKVNGSLVVIGKKVVLNNIVGGTTYSTALEFDLSSNASLNRNLYFAGASMVTETGSLINRDLFVAALGAQMMGSVQGETKVIIGPAEFVYLIMDWIKQSTGNLPLTNKSVATVETRNDFRSIESTSAGMIYSALGNLKPEIKPAMITYPLQSTASIDWTVVGNWFLERLRELVRIFFFGLLGLWLIPKLFLGSAQLLRTKPLSSTGWGLLSLVVSFNLIGLVVLLVVVILAIGIFLGEATLWDLAWSFMAISGFSLGLISTIVALFVLYVSKAIVTYLIGRIILERFISTEDLSKILSLLIGVIIYTFLAAIPLLGWVITILITALGLGSAFLYYRNSQVSSTKHEEGGLVAA